MRRTAKDKDLKAYAEKHLPALREHLKLGEELIGKLDGDGKKE